MKYKIRQYSIQYSKKRAKLFKKELEELEQWVTVYENDLESKNSNKEMEIQQYLSPANPFLLLLASKPALIIILSPPFFILLINSGNLLPTAISKVFLGLVPFKPLFTVLY